LGPGRSDNINRMITLSVITLSGFHCTLTSRFWEHLSDLQNISGKI